jgi:hypothetical protein
MSNQQLLLDLKEKYQEYNQQYYNAELPPIPFRWGKLKGVIAAVKFNTIGVRNGPRKLIPDSLEMVFNGLYRFDIDKLIPILLHEMVHVYIAAVLNNTTESHGNIFMKELRALEKKSGIVIPLTDSTKELELTNTEELGIVLRYQPDGKCAYAIFSPKTISNKLEDFKKAWRGEVELRIVNSEVWMRKSQSIPIQRNIGYKTRFWIMNDTDYNDLINNSTIVWTNRLNEEHYHGSVADFEEFDGAMVGTGDGALTFGWGIYVTNNIKLARSYRKRGTGKLFNVKIPAEDKLLDWNKTLSEQSPYVKSALHKMGYSKLRQYAEEKELIGHYGDDETGEDIYGMIASIVPFRIANMTRESFVQYRKRASIWLLHYGIEGIRYQDVTQYGGNNFVIFDPTRIQILKKT